MRGAVNIYPYPLPPDFDIPFPEVEETTQNLAPHTEFPAKINVGRHVTDIDERRLRAGTHRVYALAVISYKDAFEEVRESKVCSSTDGPTFMQAVDMSRQGGTGSLSHDDAWEFSARYNDWT